jgi:hypothetical protein
METKIDFNKKLSVKEAGKLIYELDKYLYEYMMLDSEVERFIFKYKYFIELMLNLFHYAYHNVASDVVYKLFEIEEE